MGFCLPHGRLWPGPAPAGERVRVVTFNVSHDPIHTAELRAWLDRERVDVVCLQEGTRTQNEARELLGEGWNVSERGSVASRFEILGQMPLFAHLFDSAWRWTGKLEGVRLRGRSGAEFYLASLHQPTMRYGFKSLLAGDLTDFRLHTEWWGRELQRSLTAIADDNVPPRPLVIAGDFNMPSDDSTMAALRAHFRFAFEEAGWGYGYTRPTGLPWMRIDHVLAGPEWAVTDCRVGPDFGSDHLPVVAELVLTPPAAGGAR
jgi:endonuclease/exonuclease/phosphatase family metal-dependent hydrolase